MQKKKIISLLKNGGVGVLPTDTIYGLVGSAFSRKAVARIYNLRKRNPKKPQIILIASIQDLNLFGISLSPQLRKVLKRLWPGKVSIVLPCNRPARIASVAGGSLKYLHRGTNTFAFRLPKNKNLISILKRTGPLVAPSANHEGLPAAETIQEAKKYFRDRVDFYMDAGRKNSAPSVLTHIKNKKIYVLRGDSALICEVLGKMNLKIIDLAREKLPRVTEVALLGRSAL